MADTTGDNRYLLNNVSTAGTVQVDLGSTLDLDDSAITCLNTSNAPTHNYTLSLHDALPIFSTSNVFEATSGILTIDQASTIANSGTLEAKGGELDIDDSQEIGRAHV